MMEDKSLVEEQTSEPLHTRRITTYVAAGLIAISGLVYAAHEHHSAQALATENQQEMAQLNATRSQIDALSAQIRQLAANEQAASQAAQPEQTEKPSPTRRAGGTAIRHSSVRRPSAYESRLRKLQSQLDEQGKEIQESREEARNDLNSARTELSGSIARTHDELVLLEKKGERNYFEFDLTRSKQFQRTGPLNISLRKANEKHQYADLNLIVDDRTVQQKHVNLDQPVMYYTPDTQMPVEIVINSITKNHIHGYISVPRYRKSELAAASGDSSNQAPTQAAGNNTDPTLRQRIPE
jgi:uncharacterized lipoprotein NlpE involved in copper resistance